MHNASMLFRVVAKKSRTGRGRACSTALRYILRDICTSAGRYWQRFSSNWPALRAMAVLIRSAAVDLTHGAVTVYAEKRVLVRRVQDKPLWGHRATEHLTWTPLQGLCKVFLPFVKRGTDCNREIARTVRSLAEDQKWCFQLFFNQFCFSSSTCSFCRVLFGTCTKLIASDRYQFWPCANKGAPGSLQMKALGANLRSTILLVLTATCHHVSSLCRSAWEIVAVMILC